MTDQTTPTPPLTAAQRLERAIRFRSLSLVTEDDLSSLLCDWRERGADLEALRARLEAASALADDLAEGLRALLSLTEAGGDPHDEPGRPTLRRVQALLARHAASKQEGQADG